MSARSARAEKPAAPTAKAAFWRGFWQPNPLVLLAALGSCAVLLAVLQLLVTSGAYTAIPEDHFLRNPTDDWGHVSWTVGYLKQHQPQRPAIYLMGGSNVRECIQTEASLSAAIAARTGVATDVHDLGSTNQHFGESMAIVENVPNAGPGGVLVIGVNHTRFSYPPDIIAMQNKGRELLLDPPALRRFTIANGGYGRWDATILPGIMNYAAGWLQKPNELELEQFTLPDNSYKEHRYTSTQIWTAAQKAQRVKLWLANRGAAGGDFDQNFTYDAALLDDMLRVARDRGFVPVLMEVPENQEIVGHQFDRFKRVYQPYCRDLAAKYGGVYVNFVGDIGLTNTDFRDLTHLVQPGRVKWTAALADALAPVVQSLPAAGGGQP